MANQKIQYTLGFKADTSQAKQQLNDLQSQLNKLANTTFNKSNFDYSTEIGKSVKAINQLQTQLHQSTNKTTGVLDLNKFNESLKKSGVTLNDYQKQFAKLGNDGTKAFLSLTESIVNAEKPLHKTSKLLDDLKTSLANTVKWQLSSSAIHGFMSAVQGAYGYAQDLNKSLNDIRIVTGQSADQMAEFAKQANNSAKALSTSTVKYTEAALIYYQQGLDDEQVKQRTDTTIKMANVTGENAADVSSYMTAIWNNFAEGSDNLEYFADVITALGAATAASSEEIAGGLEKFAAVAETVGLSYEYATAALTTIIDKTRQSEDVVGTALKTIFARIQGLQQGESQEDGVTLNKYSKALENVGISIMDTNGELKAMDDILDEMGSKWETLSKAQQVALAQTVGGTRQYTQLIALMDNWDSMQQNLDTATMSEGTLQEQADIYAESWEAAQKRVKAAWEDVYDSLLNDKFFIKMANMIADIVNSIGDMIDAMGGAKGVVSALGMVLMQVFAKDIKKGFATAQSYIHGFSGAAKAEMEKTQKDAIKLSLQMAGNVGADAEAGVLNKKAKLLDYINERSNNLTAQQKEQLKNQIAISDTIGQRVISIDDEIKKEEKLLETIKRRMVIEGADNKQQKKTNRAFNAAETIGKAQGAVNDLHRLTDSPDFAKNNRDAITDRVNVLGEIANNNKAPFSADEKQKINDFIQPGNKFFTKDGKLRIKGLDKEAFKTTLAELEELLNNKLGTISKNATKGVSDDVARSIKDGIELAADKGADELNKEMTQASHDRIISDIKEDANKKVDSNSMITFADAAMAASQAIFAFNSLVSVTSGIIDTLNNKDMTYFEKFKAIVGSLLATAPMLLMSLSSLVPTLKAITGQATLGAAAMTALKMAIDFLTGGSLLAIALIGVAVVGLIAFIADLVSLENKIKKANEELKEAKEAAKETGDAYHDLKNSISDLESAKDTLAGLKEGTQEWTEAVLQLNQQVLDLIEKYPELAQYMTSENGVLGISEEGLQKQLEAQQAQAQTMQVLALSKQRAVADLNNQKTIRDSKGFSFNETKTITKYNPNTGGAYTGQSNWTTTTESTKTTIDSKEAAEIGKKILESDAFQNGVVDFEKIGLSDASQNFKDAITENIDHILELANTFNSLDAQIEAMDKNIANTWLNTHATGINPEYANMLSSGMATVMDNQRDAVKWTINSQSDDKIIEAFAQINHSTVEEVKKNIENEVYSIEQLKDSLIDNAAATKSLEIVNGKVTEFNNISTGDKTVDDIVKNIVASAGSESSYNTLGDTQRVALLEAIQNNPELQEAFRQNADYFGEGFVDSLTKYLSDEAVYNETRQQILDEQFNQKMSDTATGLGVDKDELESYVNYLQEADDDLENNREAALAAAEANLKFAKGAEKVTKVFSDYEAALADADESTWEYHEAIAAVQEAATEMLGIEVDTTYVKKHLDDIKKAAEGDEKALTKLQKTAAVNWAENFVKGVQSVEEVVDETGKAITEGFNAENWKNDFLGVIDDVANNLGGLDTSFILDADAQPALNELVALSNEAMRAGQMTQEQMESMFASMGYSPEVTMVDVPTTPQTTTTEGSFEGPFGMKFTYSGTSTSTSTMQVPQIEDANGDGSTSFTKISGSNKLKAKAGKKANKSGSSSSPKEAERYHEIKNVVEDIGKELDAIGKAKDRAFGKDKLALMDQEIAKLEDMKAAQSQYLKEIEKFYAQDKKAVAKYGAEFDEAGRIINYDEYMKKHGANEAAVEALEQYEETYDLLKDKQQEIIDIQNQIYDAALEKTKYKVDLQINVNDDDLKYLNYLLEKLDDAAYDAAESIANLGQQAASQMSNIDAYRQGINDIFAEHGLGDDTISQFLNGSLTPEDLANMEFTEEEVNTLRNYRDGLLETNQALMEIRDNVWNEVLEAIEALGEEFDKQSDKIDHLSGVLESYQNIIGIVGQEVLGITDEMMESFSDIAVDNAIDALTVSKGKLDALKETKAELEAALADPGISESKRKELEELLDETNEMLKDAENDMLSDWEAALQAANDAFEQTTTRAIDNFKNAMAGAFGDMDTLLDDFAKTKEIDEMYLDDYKQIYELSKLNRDISKSIDDTDNIASKAALRDIQKEINDLQEAGVELSQYDLDYLRAKYELRLAEIALEDAQNAKNQVRMTRDSEGNWSYTYTADQDNIDSAQQNYEDKLYAIQELSTNYIKDLESQIVELSTSLAEEIAAIDKSVYDSEEAYLAEVERITNFYNEKMAIFAEQMNNALANNNEIYTQDWTNYSTATGYKISADEDFLTSFNETTLGIKSGFDNMQLYQIAFNQAIGTPDEEGTLLGQLSSAYETWKTRVDEAMDAAGTSTDDFKDVVVDTAEKIDEETDKAAESVEDLKETMKKEFKEALDAAKQFESKYGEKIDEIIASNDALIASLNDVIGVWSGIEQAADDATRAAQNYNHYASNPSPVGGGSGGGENNNSGGTNNTNKNNKDNNSGKKWYVTSKTGAVTVNGTISPGFATKAEAENWWNTTGTTQNHKDKKRWSNIGFIQMNTGGYTGAWGNSGKLAVLHQKELVLNADDTQNMLKSIEMVRAIARTIDLNNGMTLGWGGLSSSGVGGGKSEIVQEITINAEFPHATERNEIEAAFDSLFIRASQYANRK